MFRLPRMMTAVLQQRGLKNESKRYISVGRRLLGQSQEWQQHGIPGSNLPFDIRNIYKFTAVYILYTASGFLAPFIILRLVLLRESAPDSMVVGQQLSTTICPEGAEE